MSYKVKFYLKKQFRCLIAHKRDHNLQMMHLYEHELNGAIVALLYADAITSIEYHFLNDLLIRIVCGKVRNNNDSKRSN